MLSTVTPNSGSSESVGFDLTTFAQKGITNSLDPQDNGGGTYNYLKVDTNLAQLALFFSALMLGPANPFRELSTVPFDGVPSGCQYAVS